MHNLKNKSLFHGVKSAAVSIMLLIKTGCGGSKSTEIVNFVLTRKSLL